MNQRARRGAGAEPAPRATRKRLSPNPGPWTLNFQLVDREGPRLFAWPHPKDAVAADLALTLQTLNEEPLEDLLGRTRAGGGYANKEIDVADLCKPAQDRLDAILPQLGDDVDVVTYEFTFCYAYDDPRRIWLLFDPPQRCFYPIWWDPEHRVSGYDERRSGQTPGACADGCPHP